MRPSASKVWLVSAATATASPRIIGVSAVASPNRPPSDKVDLDGVVGVKVRLLAFTRALGRRVDHPQAGAFPHDDAHLGQTLHGFKPTPCCTAAGNLPLGGRRIPIECAQTPRTGGETRMDSLTIFVIALFVLAFFILTAAVKFVPQGQEWTIERFGALHAHAQSRPRPSGPDRGPHRAQALGARDRPRGTLSGRDHQGQCECDRGRYRLLPGDRCRARRL